MINQSIHQSINTSINQYINQSIHQSIDNITAGKMEVPPSSHEGAPPTYCRCNKMSLTYPLSDSRQMTGIVVDSGFKRAACWDKAVTSPADSGCADPLAEGKIP